MCVKKLEINDLAMVPLFLKKGLLQKDSHLQYDIDPIDLDDEMVLSIRYTIMQIKVVRLLLVIF